MTSPSELDFVVVPYPDPVLRRVALPVAAFDAELKSVVDAMYRRMAASKGVGLAAPQVGISKRILVLNPTGEAADALTLINPTITAKAGDETWFDEGCLSFPDIYAEIKRPERCTVEAVDVEGRPIRAEYAGFVSRIIQHEYDHLEGVLLVDRMSPADKQKNRAALEELVEEWKRGAKAAARTR